MQTTVLLPSANIFNSNVSYEILQRPKEVEGRILPHQLGKGRFAKVFKAIQRSAGRSTRLVAIKVLHDYVDHSAERLFRQEIDLLRGLSDSNGVNVVSMLDIVHMGPSVMCGGCGNVYHPLCPECGQSPLSRKTPQSSHPLQPALFCESCGEFELLARDVQRYEYKLLAPPAKSCCATHAGTILNFVDREALVLELIDSPGDITQNSLLRFVLARQAAMARLWVHYGRTLEQRSHLGQQSRFTSFWHRDKEEVLTTKVLLLEKVGLMKQLAEAVAWLHSEKQIVHKDLAPDNVLVRHIGDESGEGRWRGDPPESLHECLKTLVSSQSFDIKVIDFGLADKDELSRSWYEEEDVKAVWIKRPYISPEACQRKEPVTGLIFEVDPPRCRLPEGLVSTELAVMPGDILADISDSSHDHDLEIVSVIEDPPGSRHYYALFNGTPPAQSPNRQFELIRRLGEPHDIYALGGLFFYILTGHDKPVELLKAFVDLLQKSPCQLTLSAVLNRNRADYVALRSAIPEPFWQDDLMMLILRAMVRGQPQSYVHSRIDRGPRAAQWTMQEVGRIYRGLQKEVLAS